MTASVTALPLSDSGDGDITDEDFDHIAAAKEDLADVVNSGRLDFTTTIQVAQTNALISIAQSLEALVFETELSIDDDTQFPVPTTAQLTNPNQIAWGSNNSNYAAEVVAQAEPSGVYSGESDGTYVVCVAPDGSKYMNYWEGDVSTIGGAAHYDPASQQIQLDGTPTVKVTTK